MSDSKSPGPRRDAGVGVSALVSIGLVSLLCLGVIVGVPASPPEMDAPGRVVLDGPFHAGAALRGIEPSTLPTPPEEDVEPLDDDSKKYLDLFRQNWKRLIAEAPQAQERGAFAEFEQLFVRSGDYLEFVTILEHVHRTALLLHRIAPSLPAPAREVVEGRVARLFGVLPLLVNARWNLGGEDAAVELSKALVDLSPSDPDVHMARALIIELEGTREGERVDIRSLRFHAAEVLRLDPAYEGFGMTADLLRERIKQIDTRFGPPPGKRVEVATEAAAARTLGRKIGRRLEARIFAALAQWRSSVPTATGEVPGAGDGPAVPDAPTPDAPTPDAPTPDAPTPDAPTPDAPTPDAPAPDAPAPDAPTPDAPTPDAPAPDAPTPAEDTAPAPAPADEKSVEDGASAAPSE